jgi:hypothetical protein
MRVACCLFAAALLVACAAPVPRPTEAQGVVVAAASGPAGLPTSAAVVDPASTAGDSASSPKLCGCGLCDPLPSGDACKSDADCAPEVPCHAKACVAVAKSKPRTKDVMCTQQLECASADVNACGCVKGFCALYKKP